MSIKMEKIYENCVLAAKKQIEEFPEITDEQLDGYVKYLGVFVPHVRERIIKEAKEK